MRGIGIGAGGKTQVERSPIGGNPGPGDKPSSPDHWCFKGSLDRVSLKFIEYLTWTLAEVAPLLGLPVRGSIV